MMDNSFEVMRAKYNPKDNSFLLFAAGVPLHSMNENSAIAKLYFNPKNQQFVLKNKYCQHCSQKWHYFCDESSSRGWQFQQELASFDIREKNELDSWMLIEQTVSF